MQTKASSAGLNDLQIEPIDRSPEPQFRARIDGKAKPLGSLGRLEDLAVQLGLIWYPQAPRTARATVFVFAAKIRRGSRNAARESALTSEEASDGLARGASIVAASIDAGTDIVAIGEMGIGNTTSAALLMHRLAPAPLADCIGAGAGLDAAGVARKLAVAEKAASRSEATSPLDVLAEFGGYEIAMMAGAVLGSAARRRPVIIDGFIATAAALVAARLRPAARGYCVFSHRSAERGHTLLLEALDAKPYLDLGLRLGEGTGAVMAVPLLRAAAGILTEMADLADVLAGTLQVPPADCSHG